METRGIQDTTLGDGPGDRPGDGLATSPMPVIGGIVDLLFGRVAVAGFQF
ncbi:hypothetical protein [Cribrihabitans pelagius]